MSVKTFETNGKNIGENIVKLKLEESIKFLLFNHLVYIYIQRKQIFDNFLISLPDRLRTNFDTVHS